MTDNPRENNATLILPTESREAHFPLFFDPGKTYDIQPEVADFLHLEFTRVAMQLGCWMKHTEGECFLPATIEMEPELSYPAFIVLDAKGKVTPLNLPDMPDSAEDLGAEECSAADYVAGIVKSFTEDDGQPKDGKALRILKWLRSIDRTWYPFFCTEQDIQNGRTSTGQTFSGLSLTMIDRSELVVTDEGHLLVPRMEVQPIAPDFNMATFNTEGMSRN